MEDERRVEARVDVLLDGTNQIAGGYPDENERNGPPEQKLEVLQQLI